MIYIVVLMREMPILINLTKNFCDTKTHHFTTINQGILGNTSNQFNSEIKNSLSPKKLFSELQLLQRAFIDTSKYALMEKQYPAWYCECKGCVEAYKHLHNFQ